MTVVERYYDALIGNQKTRFCHALSRCGTYDQIGWGKVVCGTFFSPPRTSGRGLKKDGVADGIRTRNSQLHKLGLYH